MMQDPKKVFDLMQIFEPVLEVLWEEEMLPILETMEEYLNKYRMTLVVVEQAESTVGKE